MVHPASIFARTAIFPLPRPSERCDAAVVLPSMIPGCYCLCLAPGLICDWMNCPGLADDTGWSFVPQQPKALMHALHARAHCAWGGGRPAAAGPTRPQQPPTRLPAGTAGAQDAIQTRFVHLGRQPPLPLSFLATRLCDLPGAAPAPNCSAALPHHHQSACLR